MHDVPSRRRRCRPSELEGVDRRTYASRRKQPRQPMHRLPHAEDRANFRRQHGQRAHVPIYFSAPHRTIQNPKSLHHLPRRQINSMGARPTENLADHFPLARREVVGLTAKVRPAKLFHVEQCCVAQYIVRGRRISPATRIGWRVPIRIGVRFRHKNALEHQSVLLNQRFAPPVLLLPSSTMAQNTPHSYSVNTT